VTTRIAVLLGILVAIGAAYGGSVAGGSNGLPVGRTPVRLDPADFTVWIDNPYYPLRPGDRRVYRETATSSARRSGSRRIARATSGTSGRT
jgi:hypothetical protein